MTLQRFLLPTVVIALAAASLTSPPASAEDAEALFSRWTQQFDDKFFGRPNPEDPLFVALLKQPDADLFLLRGLNHKRDPVRRLSRLGLSRLKTDRSFEALKKGTKDPNMFVREKCIVTLGDFRQRRCVAVLLDVLRNDPHRQPRTRAARALVHYPEDRVESALLKTLKNDPEVAIEAAAALAAFDPPEAIEPVYQLVLATKDYRQRERALMALGGFARKKAIDRLFDYWKRQPYPNDPWNELEQKGIRLRLEYYARQTMDVVDPLPETREQWEAWWKETQSLFPDNMQRPAVAERAPVRPEDLGNDASNLTFEIALDTNAYRYGDPVGIDLIMRNPSSKPMRTIPPVQSGWWPTMAYGFRLERLGDKTEVLLDHAPSDSYRGSYSGPPGFQTLRAGEEFRKRRCLHTWLRWANSKIKRQWPLAEGTYRLTITFDNTKFAGVSSGKGEVLHRWQAAPVVFTIKGLARTVPDNVLKMLSEKSGQRWLKEDLVSKRSDRRDAAWLTIHRWGDTRLETYLSGLPTYSKYKRQWGTLLRPFEPIEE